MQMTIYKNFISKRTGIPRFHELTREELLQIVDLMLNEITDELAERNIHITFSNEVKEYILENM